MLHDRSDETFAVRHPVKNLSGTKRLLEIEMGRRQHLKRDHSGLSFKFWVLGVHKSKRREFEQKVAKEAKIWVDNKRTKVCGAGVGSAAMGARQP
jgi:hypothetical protein